jgi:hypothetical protein
MPQHKAIKMAIAHFQGGDECILFGYVREAGGLKCKSPAFGRAICKYQ